ncbi:MAG: putative DNA-binding domain-containing protein [Rhodospirillaceae bacterium]|nr:putative DNA-binding domain-containing protein [Rhodospirillaceae bacterium]
MSMLLESQRAFLGAIFSPAAADAAAALIRHDGIAQADRLQIYRNNTFILLTEALADTFPVVKRLVGGEFFDAMAKEFIVAYPPMSPSLLEYGGHMAVFMETFAPVSGLPYLPDVARLEWAWTKAYHAADAEPLTAATLADRGSSDLGELRFRLHPSARFVTSDFPVGRIWEANSADGEPEAISLDDGPSHILVIRPEAEVQVRLLSPAAFEFFLSLAGGATVAEAFSDPDFDLQNALAVALTDGTFSRNPA